MSDNLIKISGSSRSESGKKYARKTRVNGLIPANIIGGGKSTPIELDPKWLHRVYKEHNKEFILELDGGDAKQVKIHEIQLHPVKRIPLHVDLMYV